MTVALCIKEEIMAERKDTPFTGEHFAAWCEKMVGQPYWYGGVVYIDHHPPA